MGTAVPSCSEALRPLETLGERGGGGGARLEGVVRSPAAPTPSVDVAGIDNEGWNPPAADADPAAASFSIAIFLAAPVTTPLAPLAPLLLPLCLEGEDSGDDGCSTCWTTAFTPSFITSFAEVQLETREPWGALEPILLRITTPLPRPPGPPPPLGPKRDPRYG